VGETVEILTDNSLTFTVHKNVLLQSPFFATALKPEWVSARDGKPIDLTDVHPDTFAPYVQWLYTHHIDTTFDTGKWARAYALGEKLMDVEYQDDIIEVFMHECEAKREYPTGTQIAVIYGGTMAGSPARKLLVDFFCWAGGRSWMDDTNCAGMAPTDFINDLLMTLLANKNTGFKGSRPWVAGPSAYFVGSRKKAE